MVLKNIKRIVILTALGLMSSSIFASGTDHSDSHHDGLSTGAACEGFGPQTPRDIDGHQGTNKQLFALAPKSENMNLCNIHFHNNAEHKAKDFSIYASEGEHGHGVRKLVTNPKLLSIIK